MSGGFNPMSVLNPATLLGTALGGPLGAIIAQALQQVVSQVVQEIIQKAGDQLGVPQPFIDAAQGAFAQSIGDTAGGASNLQEAIGGLSSALGQTGAQAGDFQRQATDATSTFVDDMVRQINQNVNDEANERNGNGVSGGKGVKGGSVLMKIALAIGSALDNKVDRMADIADELGSMGEVKGDEQSRYQELSAEMNALGQEMKIVAEALNNTLKSIGEASSALARKQ